MELKSQGYYDLKGDAQYRLYEYAKNAAMWRNWFAGLAGFVTLLFLLTCAVHVHVRQELEERAEKADARTLLMVEQLKRPAYARPN